YLFLSKSFLCRMIQTIIAHSFWKFHLLQAIIYGLANLFWHKCEIIGRNHRELHPLPLALEGKTASVGVDVSVIAAAHAVLLHHRKKLGDAVLHKDGRIVQKQNLLLL